MKVQNNKDGSLTFSRTVNGIDYSLTVEGVTPTKGRKMFTAFVRESEAIIKESKREAQIRACLTCPVDSKKCKGERCERIRTEEKKL